MYDPTEVPNRIDVQFLDMGGKRGRVVKDCMVYGHAMKFPTIELPGGGRVEVSRETLIRCHKEGRPVLV